MKRKTFLTTLLVPLALPFLPKQVESEIPVWKDWEIGEKMSPVEDVLRAVERVKETERTIKIDNDGNIIPIRDMRIYLDGIELTPGSAEFMRLFSLLKI